MSDSAGDYVIWDWNGTLLDDVQACLEAINGMLAPRGLPVLTVERYREVFGFPVRNYYVALGFDFAREDWDALAREFHERYFRAAADAPLRPGAREALDALRAAGHPMAVLSALESGHLDRMLDAHGLRGCFRHVGGLEDLFAASKVDRGLRLLAEAGADPARTVLVGDTVHDAEVASALGCRCLLVDGGHQSAARLRACGARVVPDLDAVRRDLA